MSPTPSTTPPCHTVTCTHEHKLYTADLNTIVPLDRPTSLSIHQETKSSKAVVDGHKDDIRVVHNVLSIIQVAPSISLCAWDIE